MWPSLNVLKARQKFGKYRIERRLAEGGFAVVYQALDTIEGIRVALKVPHAHVMDKDALEDFRHEARLTAKLDHPNIQPLKNAGFIDGQFAIAWPLAERTLDDRLQHRMALKTALDYAEQILEAVAYAHRHRIIHCDIKPDNVLLFDGDKLRLTDFGIAKLAARTVRASGEGTMGYMAPEQAMGKPSLRSDVFSLGLVIYRMLSGRLPEWPYHWPPPGYERLRGRVHPELVELLRRAMDVDPQRRFHDANQMLEVFRKLKKRALRHGSGRRTRKKKAATTRRDWQAVRFQQFQRLFGRTLQTRFECKRCHGPVAESMIACPWCGTSRKTHRDETRFPARCRRCKRGVKLDWTYCPWCYGAAIGPLSEREYSDVRYVGRCPAPGCKRRSLMPFMRYCPWCRAKVRKPWKLDGTKDKCNACGWGVAGDFWEFCPWCAKRLAWR